MRTLLKVTIPVESGNAKINDGTLSKTLESVLSELKPEAAYFCAEKGERTAFVVFDMKDTSQIPAIAEPFFLMLNARVEFQPVMNLQDLQKAQSGIDAVVKKYSASATARAA